MSFINAVLDVYDDLAAGMPIAKDEIKKVAELDVYPDPESVPDAAFGLNVMTKEGSIIRKFLLRNPDDAALSVFYFTKVAEKKLPPKARQIAATFIKAACEHHKVPTTGLIHKYASAEITDNEIKLSEIEGWHHEPEISDNDFALITETGKKTYPINTPERVKIAATYFRDNYKRMAPAHRHQMAENITKKAAAQGIEFPHEDVAILEKYASDRYSNILEIAVSERRDALQNRPDAQRTLDKLMEKRAGMEPIQFAHALESFDQMNGLNEHWDRGIIDPYQSTFGGIKIAHPIYKFGKAISREKIAALASNDEALKKHFDPKFIAEFQSQPVEIFESLPAPDQRLMVSMMEE